MFSVYPHTSPIVNGAARSFRFAGHIEMIFCSRGLRPVPQKDAANVGEINAESLADIVFDGGRDTCHPSQVRGGERGVSAVCGSPLRPPFFAIP